MPWQNQGGGGGPWGGGGGGGGPWGNSPWGRGGGGGSNQPNVEELIKQAQEKLKRILPKGPGGSSPNLLFYGLGAIVLLWILSGIYRVQPGEQGVVMRFGAYVDTAESGLHYHLPYPIETVIKPRVEQINAIDVGFRSTSEAARGQKRDVPDESSMLTGDQNIIEIDFNVQWKIKNAGQFLFNIRDPEATVKVVAESAIREIIGRTEIQPALTEARRSIEEETRSLLQQILDEYKAGIEITQVQLQEVQPPQQVIDAFNDVQRALQDRDRMQNEAEAYRNDIIPRARGEAVKQVQDASAYKEKVVNESTGNAQRFLSVYNEYKNARDVTTKRIYFETMEQILRGAKKIVAGDKAGLAPYLPLPVPPQSTPAPKSGGTP
jgi:membrane protease subunit HflK